MFVRYGENMTRSQARTDGQSEAMGTARESERIKRDPRTLRARAERWAQLRGTARDGLAGHLWLSPDTSAWGKQHGALPGGVITSQPGSPVEAGG